jgi:hypothetical protein
MQVIQLSVFSIAHHMANFFRNNLRVVKTGVVEAFRNLQINKKGSFSQGMISTLEAQQSAFHRTYIEQPFAGHSISLTGITNWRNLWLGFLV